MKWIGDFSIVFTEKKCRQAPAHAWSRIDVNLTPPERHPWANHFINVIRCAQIWITNLQVFKVIDNNRPKMFELCLVLHRWLFHGIQLKFHCAEVLIDITYIYIYMVKSRWRYGMWQTHKTWSGKIQTKLSPSSAVSKMPSGCLISLEDFLSRA